MKKLILVLILAIMVAGGAFAEWYDSYAPGIEGYTFLVNIGIGYGFLPYNMAFPPVSVSVEYMLDFIPLSVGGYVGYTAYKETVAGWGTYDGTMLGIGAKASWHFNFFENFDPYVSLTAGWLIWNEKLGTVNSGLSTFFYSGNIGARYFFTNNIGAYIELGYSAISVASIGLALKF